MLRVVVDFDDASWVLCEPIMEVDIAVGVAG